MIYIRKMHAVLLIVLIVIVSSQISYAGSVSLKVGTQSEEVRMLQMSLKELGYFTSEPTGYFGSITKSVEVNGYKLAASMTARPHAGRDDKPEGAVVGSRSGYYGKGTNFYMVKGNKMDGHIDIHFLNSRTHNTGKVDQKHQMVIREAYALANG